MDEQIHAYNLTPGDVIEVDGVRVTVKEIRNVVGACWIISQHSPDRYRINDADTVVLVQKSVAP